MPTLRLSVWSPPKPLLTVVYIFFAPFTFMPLTFSLSELFVLSFYTSALLSFFFIKFLSDAFLWLLFHLPLSYIWPHSYPGSATCAQFSYMILQISNIYHFLWHARDFFCNLLVWLVVVADMVGKCCQANVLTEVKKELVKQEPGVVSPMSMQQECVSVGFWRHRESGAGGRASTDISSLLASHVIVRIVVGVIAIFCGCWLRCCYCCCFCYYQHDCVDYPK